ncbi:UDP-2,3-diacylglucosamine diphosphatase [Ferruginibacter sp. SUN002]|uniref:UDP-2,3-diacylglucosamine diphosphatase n=1 Tax=Ferruginibacter sp. SUN002 TaxID=2937789 RepID=UPI003D363D9E
MEKRIVDIAVLSDIHLGTYGCHAEEVVDYLKSISPQILILNGDIIDGWQFSKRYFPVSHMQVIKEIMSMLSKGTRIVYITGNHDEMLRRYSDLQMGNFLLTDKFVIEMNGKTTWFFHGDVFDATTRGSAKILAKLGGHGYDMLILLNRFINATLKLFGREKMSFSKKVKNSVKKAVSWIGDFEQTAAELAINKGYDYVACGHIHQPQKRVITGKEGSVVYLNSGDWVENLTALEFVNDEWNIYQYDEKKFSQMHTRIITKDNKLPELNVMTDEVSLFFNSLFVQ